MPYSRSNPPFGVDWKKAKKVITDEHENAGFAGRFGAGLPHINDGSLLFLQHMISIYRGHPLKGESREKTPLHVKKTILFHLTLT